MRNRIGLPDAIRYPTRLSDDEVRAFRLEENKNMLAIEWRAAKKTNSVMMLSTARTTGRELSKPTIVHDYNQCMNAVDRADQCYAFVRTTIIYTAMSSCAAHSQECESPLPRRCVCPFSRSWSPIQLSRGLLRGRPECVVVVLTRCAEVHQ